MKIQRCVAALLLFIYSFAYSYAQAEAAQTKVKKIYIDERAVKVTKKGIIIHTGQGLLKVKTLRSDKLGLFVFEHELSLTEKWAYQCRCYRIFPSEKALATHWARCPLNDDHR